LLYKIQVIKIYLRKLKYYKKKFNLNKIKIASKKELYLIYYIKLKN